MKRQGLKWRDRKRNFLSLPWTFTIYSLDNTRLFIETGFLNKTENEVRLYRIMDLSLTRNIWQRLIRTGTIHVVSADKTMQNFRIKNIRKSFEVKEMLSEAVERARRESRVYAREDMNTQGDGPDSNPDMFDQDPFNYGEGPDMDGDMDGDMDMDGHGM